MLDCSPRTSRYEDTYRWLREPGAKELVAAEQKIHSRRVGTLSALRAEYDAEIAERRAEIEENGSDEDEDEDDLDASYEMSLWLAYEPHDASDEEEDGDWDEPDEVEQTARLVADAIDAEIEHNVHMKANLELDSFIISLIGATSPTVLRERSPSDLGLYAEEYHPNSELYAEGDHLGAGITYIQHYPLSTRYYEKPPQLSWQNDTARVTQLWKTRHVRLAPDYPDGAVQGTLHALKFNGGRGLPLLGGIRKWSWTTPKGQIFELDMADLCVPLPPPPPRPPLAISRAFPTRHAADFVLFFLFFGQHDQAGEAAVVPRRDDDVGRAGRRTLALGPG